MGIFRKFFIFILFVLHGVCAGATLPNILYILCDDLGYGDVQVLNLDRGKIKTPHLDQLAEEGIVFTDAHAGASVCTPSRYGVLTGRYAWRTFLQEKVLKDGDPRGPLIDQDRLTVPALLKQVGYATAIIGKWHLGYTFVNEQGVPIQKVKKRWSAGVPVGSKVDQGPTTRGFDYYIGFHHSGAIETLVENDEVVAEMPAVEMLQFLGDSAVKYIGEQSASETPFFLYLPLNSPHKPIVPSKAWQGKSGMGAYGDFVMETDFVVGRVLEALEMEGISTNTLVFFTSDNGGSAGPAKADTLQKEFGHYISGDYRGAKSDGWDGGHRVPFFVRWPGRIQAGTTNDALVCLTSLMATVAELTGQDLQENQGEDSISMLPLLLQRDFPPRMQPFIVHHSYYGKFAIRKGKWKLCLFPGSGGWSEPRDRAARNQSLPEYQLYDMERDPSETTNLVEEYPEVIDALLTLLQKKVADGRSTPGKQQSNDVEIDLFKIDR